MPSISRKELEKFMKNNPDAPATQAIKEQLQGTPSHKQNKGACYESDAGPAEIRNTASNLAAEKVNGLHHEVLNGFKDICVKAIEIGQILNDQKSSLKHGEWTDWVDNKLEIGARQVQNYIKIYRHRKDVLASMEELVANGIKPSIRKMLIAATDKDTQTAEEYQENCQKTGSNLTPKDRKQWRMDKKREKEIAVLTNMVIDKAIDDHALKAFVWKWNTDNPNNTPLSIADVKEEVRQMDEELYPDIFNPSPSIKTNIMLSVDAGLWDEYVKFGGSEAHLDEHVKEFLMDYINTKNSYRIAN